MTNRLEINWKLDGFVDEQRYYCSETPIDLLNLPTPKAILSGEARAYVDTDIVLGTTYYIRVEAVKNGVSKISGEVLKVAGGGWLPSTLESLRSWLVSDNPLNTLVSSQLDTLADKSGHSAIASPYSGMASDRAVIIQAGLNGRDVWRRVNGAPTGALNISDNTISKNVSGLTMAIVTKLSASIGTADANVFRINTPGGGTAWAMIGRGYYGPNYVYAGGRRLYADGFHYVTNGVDVGTDWLVIVAVFDYASAKLKLSVNGSVYINNSFQTPGNSENGDSGSTGIGHRGDGPSTASSFGDYAETLLFNSAVSDQNRQKIEGYLAWQWGLQSSLPIGHPFKSIPPSM